MFNFKKVKKIICLILLFLLLFSIRTVGVVSPTKDFFVNDYADILTEETKNCIIQTNLELQQKIGAQIVVITVKSLEGKSIEEYATEVFRKFGIGDSEKNNGVLMLCSTEERLFRIEVGYGLEETLTDGKTGRIQDEYIIPYLRNNNYDEGIKNGFSAILEEISNEYNLDLVMIENNQNNSISIETGVGFGIGVVYFIASCIVIFGKKKFYKKIIFCIISVLSLVIIDCFFFFFLKTELPLSVSIFCSDILLLLFSLIIKALDHINWNGFGGGSNYWNGGSSGGGFSSGGSSGGGFSSGGSSGGGGTTRNF